jgi:hypothetical protein
MRFVAAAAVVVTIGLGSGAGAYAASGSAPALTPASRHCSGLTLTPVPGVKAPKVTAIEKPVPAHARAVACDTGITSGR